MIQYIRTSGGVRRAGVSGGVRRASTSGGIHHASTGGVTRGASSRRCASRFYVAPAPSVSITQVPEVEYLVPAPAVFSASASVVVYIMTETALSNVAAALTVYAAPAPVAENARGGVHCARGCRVLDTSTRGRVHHSCAVFYVAVAVCAMVPPCQHHTSPMWHQLHMRMTWRQLQPWSSTSRRRQPYPAWRQRQCSLHKRQQTRMPAGTSSVTRRYCFGKLMRTS